MVQPASILGPAMFQWDAPWGHIRDIVATGNVVQGNVGVMLHPDVFYS